METAHSKKNNLLVSAAKVIGGAVGTVASAVGSAPASPHTDNDGKLAKKHKHRLPRRQKKALKAHQAG